MIYLVIISKINIDNTYASSDGYYLQANGNHSS